MEAVKTTTQHYDFQVTLLLTLLVLFIIAYFIFFILTWAGRSKRIKKEARKASYQKVVDKMLFELLFEESASVTMAADNFKIQADKANLLKKVAIKSINALHRNYTGEMKKKLEEFYVESGLVNYSLRKINSSNWAKTVEAIRDLSNLSYQPAYGSIYTKLKHPKKVVQKEAFIGVILLKGLDELVNLKDSAIYLDDWTQSNILYVVKRDRLQTPQNIELLLTSQNETIILLGARLIQYFQLHQYIPAVEAYLLKNQESRLSSKINDINYQLKNIL